jgi:MerR family redox-sensitive transcriptional activator SoxR
VHVKIGELARRAGVSPSAVRYYERAGLLPAPRRTNNQRVYAADGLPRLAVILHARRIGVRISETRRLVTLFPPAGPSARWKALAAAKLDELDAIVARAEAMRTMLQLISRCRCDPTVPPGWTSSSRAGDSLSTSEHYVPVGASHFRPKRLVS